MGLLERIGHSIGKSVIPLKEAKTVGMLVPFFQSQGLQAVPLPKFEGARVFKVPSGIIQKVPLTPNLLFSIPDSNYGSGFSPLLSDVLRVQEPAFQPAEISANLIGLFPLLEAKTWVSENLFDPLSSSKSSGKKYSEQADKTQTQSSLFPELPAPAQRSDFKKAYTRVKTPNSISTQTTQSLSIWDLIYPILLPPLSFDFIPQLDVLESLRPYQKTGISFLVDHESAL